MDASKNDQISDRGAAAELVSCVVAHMSSLIIAVAGGWPNFRGFRKVGFPSSKPVGQFALSHLVVIASRARDLQFFLNPNQAFDVGAGPS